MGDSVEAHCRRSSCDCPVQVLVDGWTVRLAFLQAVRWGLARLKGPEQEGEILSSELSSRWSWAVARMAVVSQNPDHVRPTWYLKQLAYSG